MLPNIPTLTESSSHHNILTAFILTLPKDAEINQPAYDDFCYRHEKLCQNWPWMLASLRGGEPVGSRSGLRWGNLLHVAKTIQMEKSPDSGDCVYMHCKGCEGDCGHTCKGPVGRHIAEDCNDLLMWKPEP
jgi:hypothetical protein